MFKRIGGYLKTLFRVKAEGAMNPEIEIEQAIQEAREQDQRLRTQAAKVIAHRTTIEQKMEDAADAVSTPPDVIDYVEELIDDGLYADDVDGFFNEQRAYFVQEPRLRQFRVMPMMCQTPKILRGAVRCVEKLGRENLDTRNHGVEWGTTNASKLMGEWAFERSQDYPAYKGSLSSFLW